MSEQTKHNKELWLLQKEIIINQDSLQYYQIAACTLNASFAPKEDSEIKKLLKTKDELIAIIAIGDCPEKINIARSIRKEKDSIINYIK